MNAGDLGPIMRKRVLRALRPGQNEAKPLVSLVVIVYAMPRQAARTIFSLSAQHQVDVSESDYEIIVVENTSDDVLGGPAATESGGNIRYFLRHETAPTPVHAVNVGAGQARGQMICLLIDGARMASPGVVKSLLLGQRLSPDAVVSIPSYHLGRELQQKAVHSGYDAVAEEELIKGIGWPQDGYRLFDIACLSGSSASGFLVPNAESNCLGVPAWLWRELGGCDARFDLRGGGLVNPDLYKRVCEHPRSTLFVVPGEGSFHQFHGGVTTGGEPADVREDLLSQYRKQYEAIRGAPFRSPRVEPSFLGPLPAPALRFMQHSVTTAMRRRGLEVES